MDSTYINSSLAAEHLLDSPFVAENLRQSLTPSWIAASVLVALLTVLTSSALAKARSTRPLPTIPVATLDEEGLSAKESWLYRCQTLITKGRKLYPGGYQIMSGSGPRIVLPNTFADEIKKIPQWEFFTWLAKDFFADYPGFEPLGPEDSHLLVNTVRAKVNQALGSITDDLSEESTYTLDKHFGNSTEWKTSTLMSDVRYLVSHLSSRVFLGKRVARNEDWVRVTQQYAVAVNDAVQEMRKWNAYALPLVHRFLPQCQLVRKRYSEARKIIEEEVQLRSETYRKALAAGEKPAKLFDAVSWAHEMAKEGEEVDHTRFQIKMSAVAIPTTTETISHAMTFLCEHPELFKPLREEIIEVIGTHGWQKTTLYKMRLMDSFLKEVQRMRPLSNVLMRRISGDKPVTLTGGMVVPPHSQVSMSMEHMMDPAVFPEPEKFDAYRFLRLRERPGGENQHQFVTLSPHHTAWGYGEHACPGRFFAANEIKIALAHMLLKYDWRFPDGQTTRAPEFSFEARISVSSTQQIQYRRRQEEIPL